MSLVVQWKFEPLGPGYSIRSLSNGSYMTVEAGIGNGVPIVGSPFPVSWELEADRSERGVWRQVESTKG